MGRPSAKHYIESLFAPFVVAAERPELASKLTTARLPQSRRDQLQLLSTLGGYGGACVLLPSDSFVFRFRNRKGLYLCVQTDGLSLADVEQIGGWAQDANLIETPLEESSFLFLVRELNGIYKPKTEFLSKSSADNIINIIGPGYKGHDFYDVQKWYRELTIFEIPSDNLLQLQNNYGIAARIAAATSALRSPIIDRELAVRIQRLTQSPNVNPENLYFALTSNHWKHVVIELYKCIEAAFYLPWTRSLRDVLGHSATALDLAKHCKSELGWREKEKASIEKLFEMIPDPIVISPAVTNVRCFSEIAGSEAKAAAFGRMVYRIRNGIVHQRDYEDEEPIYITSREWPILANYLCELLYYLYTNFSGDLSYLFEVSE
jgi:hypothetical protein